MYVYLLIILAILLGPLGAYSVHFTSVNQFLPAPPQRLALVLVAIARSNFNAAME